MNSQNQHSLSLRNTLQIYYMTILDIQAVKLKLSLIMFWSHYLYQLYFPFLGIIIIYILQNSNLAIQLMQSSLNIVASFSDKIIQNPEVEEVRCRICYEEAKPLITLCQCSGTIAYVHEDCILDWITKKMESSETVEIPKCQICRVTYSAKLKIGRKKICYQTLFKKIRDLQIKQILKSLFYLISTILAFFLAAKGLFMLATQLLTKPDPNPKPATTQQLNDNILAEIFKVIVYPLFFVKSAINHGRKRLKLWDDSMVQIVQLTLNPKLTIKN